MSSVATLQPLNKARVLSNACHVFGVEMDELKGPGRQRHVVTARMAAYYVLRHHRHLSYLQIGQTFGRDHSTVISGVRRIAALIKDDRRLRLQVTRCGL